MLKYKLISYSNLKCVSSSVTRHKILFGNLENNQITSPNRKHLKYSTSNNGPWKVLFFGNDAFSLESINALNIAYKERGLLQCLEVVSSNKETPVAKYAKKYNIKLHSWPSDINEKVFDIGVVASFGYLIPSRVIKLFPLGIINVHGSILPKWRGAAPVTYALINGDTETGISILKILPKKFDVGAIIIQEKIEIHPEETHIELEKKLARVGADLLIKTITQLPDILTTAKSQTEEGVTYAPKVTKDISFIKWNTMTAKNVYDLQRGLNGIEPLRTYFNNTVVKLLNVKTVPESISINYTKYIKEKVPGIIMFNKKNKTLCVSCKDNSWITVDAVIFPNLKPKSAIQFSSSYILNDKSKYKLFY